MNIRKISLIYVKSIRGPMQKHRSSDTFIVYIPGSDRTGNPLLSKDQRQPQPFDPLEVLEFPLQRPKRRIRAIIISQVVGSWKISQKQLIMIHPFIKILRKSLFHSSLLFYEGDHIW